MGQRLASAVTDTVEKTTERLADGDRAEGDTRAGPGAEPTGPAGLTGKAQQRYEAIKAHAVQEASRALHTVTTR